jgi:calcium/calmodulin-dependent protein kinase (CaM kinase) II
MTDDVKSELLSLNQQLLDSIAQGDWDAYQRLCEPTLTAFAPEALGHLVEGMSFHRFYFDLKRRGTSNTTMTSPHVRVLGDTAVITYVRLVQRLDEHEHPVKNRCLHQPDPFHAP